MKVEFKLHQKVSRLEIATAKLNLISTSNKIKVYEKDNIRYILEIIPNDEQEVIRVYRKYFK